MPLIYINIKSYLNLSISLSLTVSLSLCLSQQKVLGGEFFNRVCGHLKLLEKEYFGLEFRHRTGNYVRHAHAHARTHTCTHAHMHTHTHTQGE